MRQTLLRSVDPALDRLLFRGSTVAIGSFHAPAGHPRFDDSGPTGGFLCVFPRTTVTIQHEGRAGFVAGPPVVTFYNQGQRYRRGRVTAEGDRCDWFALAPEVAGAIVAERDAGAPDRPGRPFLFDRGPSAPELYLGQRTLVEGLRSGEISDPLEIEERALRIARTAIDAAQNAWAGAARSGRLVPARSRERRREITERAKELLLADLASNPGLSELARSVDCSPHHLCRVFRRETGWSLHRFRTEARLRIALEQIRERRGDLTGLALDLGFSSHSHFTAAFRATFGLPPSRLAAAAG